MEESHTTRLTPQAALAELSTNVVHLVSRTGEHTKRYEGVRGTSPGVVEGVLLEPVRRASSE